MEYLLWKYGYDVVNFGYDPGYAFELELSLD